MIQIIKGNAPEDLITSGSRDLEILESAFDEHQDDFINATRKFAKEDITGTYKLASVKESLNEQQHSKCCFSEAKFEGDFRHVEHFRPKLRVDEWPSGVHTYPGYYWLAYAWSNLFLCKQLINVSYKKNFFPLLEGSIRNWNHHDANIEIPLLIDPSIENPRDYIRFHYDEPIMHNDSERGRLNIILLGLRHPDFEEGRRKTLQILQRMKDVVDIAIAEGLDINHPILAGPLITLRESMLPEAEYSSMAIDFLSGWPHIQ
jgi:uncharacterized protein (TIGR02646 family)